jgi:uncharacterized damage-inducible protein DinB
MMNVIESIRVEYLRYKTLAEEAIAQLTDADLVREAPGGGNSIATICWHVSGNLRSRFTDFLTTDGEKPWRHRDEEFAARSVSRAELLEKWRQGWEALLAALDELRDEHLDRDVVIRGQTLRVHEALHRSLAHTSYHVGQVVYLAKGFRGTEWKYLSIPPGGSDAYNKNPTLEKSGVRGAATTQK